MAAVRKCVRRCYSVEAELVFIALVLVAWQAVRIPLEGTVAVSLEHSESVLRLEDALKLDIEASLIRSTSELGITSTLSWLYSNIHLPVLFGFVAAVRLLRPDQYPRFRTVFVLSFVPAVLVIGIYPLAPPRWVLGLGLGPAPHQAELATSGALFHNETAALASQHFGFSLFVAAASVWLFPRSRLLWVALAYPALVFLVIVGTGNHYVIDCLVGSLTFVLAALGAWFLHRSAGAPRVAAQASAVAVVALSWAFIAWGVVSLDVMTPASWSNVGDALVLAVGAAGVLSPRLGVKEALAESG